MVGYAAYCPSKYAVRGLAECLRNEVGGVTKLPTCPPLHQAVLQQTAVGRRGQQGQVPHQTDAVAAASFSDRGQQHPMATAYCCRALPSFTSTLVQCADVFHLHTAANHPKSLHVLLCLLLLPPPCSAQLQGSNVKVSIAYPPDVSTPGYAKENLSKVCMWSQQDSSMPDLSIGCCSTCHLITAASAGHARPGHP